MKPTVQLLIARTTRVLVIVLGVLLGSLAHAAEKDGLNADKKLAVLWYEAFSQKDSSILDRILSDAWVDIPSPADAPAGPQGVKPIFTRLITTFPDLKLTIKDILQDGDKVVVRAEMTGTQKEAFMGFVSRNRVMAIQVVDIHQVKDGQIIRTWHTEDWMSGLRQLGVFGETGAASR